MGKSIRLDQHPNYKSLTPMKDETLVEFTLRWAAHLISPPKYSGESEENECVEVAEQVLELDTEIQDAWNKHHQLGCFAPKEEQK